MLEGSHELSVLSSEFMKGPCALPKEGGNGVHRMACFELFGERWSVNFVPVWFS